MGKKKVAKELSKEGLGLKEDGAGLENTECQKDVVVKYKKKKRSKQLDGGSEHFASQNQHQNEEKCHKVVDNSLTEDRKKNKKKKLEKEDEADRKKRKKNDDGVSADEIGGESLKADLDDGNPDVNLLDKIDADSFNGTRDEKHKRHKKRKHREGIDAILLPGENFRDSQTSELDKTNKDKTEKRKKKKKKTTQGEQSSIVVSEVKEDGMLLGDDCLENHSKKKEKKREKKKGSKVQNNIGTDEEGDHGKATKMGKKVKVRNTKVATSEHSVEDSQHSGLQSTKKKSKKVSFADHVEVFTSADSLSESDADDGEQLVRGKRFSEEEDELVRKAVYDFIEAKELGENGIEMVLHCKDYPEIKKICWKEIAAALPWRPLASVYHRAHVLFERAEERTWTAEEYNLVKKFHEEHGADWRKLGDALGKHRFHVKDAWRRIKVANLKKGHWSQEEYQTLFDLVNLDICMKAFDEKKSKHGMLRDNIAWTAISDKMATRVVSSCCDKWYRQLTSPMVVEGKWADADDYRLLNVLVSLDACSMEDVDWDNLIDGRSGNLCRKRWSQMVRHIGDYGSKSFAEQVELLSNRYSPDVLESREAFDNRPVVP